MADVLFRSRRHTREDSGLRLDRNLVWWHDDERIEHPKIIETFNVSLVPVEGGRFQLQVGNDWCFVEVEDAAYRVNAIDPDPDGKLWLRLSDRRAEACDLSSLRTDADGVLTCQVKEGRAKARFSRDAQFELGSLLEAGEGRVALRLGAHLVPLPDGVDLSAER